MPARIIRIVALTLLFTASIGLAQDRPMKPTNPPLIDYAALNKLGWKLSCQAYTFREMSALETLQVLQNLGIHYVEFYPGQKFSTDRPDIKLDHALAPELIDQLRKKLSDCDVTAINYGVVELPNDEVKARKVFNFAKTLGLKTIVSEPPEDAFDLLDRLAAEYQINVAIHDHPKPSHYWNPEVVLNVCQGRSNRIGACADVGHWYRSDVVPLVGLKKLQGRIISLHFKDIAEDKKDVPWGTGQCDIKALMAELKRQGAPLVFSIEYESTTGQELIDNVARSIEYFSLVATELAKG
jgi:sugar phosphate isomerase/epimerase